MSDNSIRHIWNIEVDGRDWPKGLIQEEKDWLIARVREQLAKGEAPFWHIHSYVMSHSAPGWREPHPPEGIWRGAVLQDFLYACTERALREAGEQVWRAKVS